jgi:hypothetical protein
MPLSVKYRYGARCRQRAYEAKVKAEAEAVGLRVAPSLKAVRASTRTTQRQADAQNATAAPRKRRTELRVSFRKAVEVVAENAALMPMVTRAQATRSAEQILARALTPRQLEALREREAA